MAKFSEAIKRAADDAERMASALGGLSAPGAGGGGGGGGAVAPAITFNTTIQAAPNSGRGGRVDYGGPGTGTGTDLQSRAFAFYGLSSANKSQAFIDQIIRAFSAMLAKGSVAYRTQGMS